MFLASELDPAAHNHDHWALNKAFYWRRWQKDIWCVECLVCFFREDTIIGQDVEPQSLARMVIFSFSIVVQIFDATAVSWTSTVHKLQHRDKESYKNREIQTIKITNWISWSDISRTSEVLTCQRFYWKITVLALWAAKSWAKPQCLQLSRRLSHPWRQQSCQRQMTRKWLVINSHRNHTAILVFFKQCQLSINTHIKCLEIRALLTLHFFNL